LYEKVLSHSFDMLMTL